MSGIIKDNQGRSSGLVKSGVTTYDDDKLQSNIALLGFKTAVNGSLAKYSLQDQIIDEYEDASGIDASASTNENLSSGVYNGQATTTPTISEDADTTTVDGDYTWYRWTTVGAGSYENNVTQDHIWLVVAGGGGGAGGSNLSDGGAGAGAGGYRYGTTLSLTGGNTYTVTVGDGGAGGSGAEVGATGGDSSIAGTGITTITSSGGGGGRRSGATAGDGGSGGGGGYNGTSGSAIAITQYTAAGETTTVQGYDGAIVGSNYNQGGGGGGAGQIGQPGSQSGACGAGGAGVANSITGSSVTYAGGGGGGPYYAASGGGAGGAGGGGAGGNRASAGTAGTDGLGGGGGSHGGYATGTQSGAEGGSGVVILRRLTGPITADGGDLTLQSTDTTASTANPDYADMVVLMEDAAGTATLNTDIKGYISEDSGVTFTQGTFVDEGSWGTNKKIIAFHDLDISAQSGSSMCYKITTHNQSASTKETKIHATSIGWKA